MYRAVEIEISGQQNHNLMVHFKNWFDVNGFGSV